MTIIYIIACLALGWFAWKLLNFIVGYWAIHSNPIRSGQAYIKGLLQRNSVINAGLIPDEAYKDIASLAYGMADLSYEYQKTSLKAVYMNNLDIFIQQIEIVMTGQGTDFESNVAKILVKYGVQIPKSV